MASRTYPRPCGARGHVTKGHHARQCRCYLALMMDAGAGCHTALPLFCHSGVRRRQYPNQRSGTLRSVKQGRENLCANRGIVNRTYRALDLPHLFQCRRRRPSGLWGLS